MLKQAPPSLGPPGAPLRPGLPPPPGAFVPGMRPPGMPGMMPGMMPGYGMPPGMPPGMMRPPGMGMGMGLRPMGPPGAMMGMRAAPGGAAGAHQTGLTPSLLALFVPRPPVEYMPAPAKPKKTQPMTGVAAYVDKFTDPADDPPPAPKEKKETKEEKKLRRRMAAEERNARALEEAIEKWDPKEDPKAKDSDPYKTLFVGRLSYDVDESKLRREFEQWGPVKSVRVVEDVETGKPRGYAFIEYNRESDMKTAYKQADGRRIENKRVVVDAERGRTVPDWKPRRLGGGLGRTRKGAKHENSLVSGRDQAYHSRDRPSEGDGYRGGGDDRRGGGYAPPGYDDRGRDHPRGYDDRGRRDDRGRGGRDSRRGGYDDRGRARDRSRDRAPRDRSRDRDRDRSRDRDRDRDSRRMDRDRDSRRSDRDRDRDRDRKRSRSRSRDDRDGGGRRRRDSGGFGAPPPPPPPPAEDGEMEEGEL